jgi:hypothetical protein
MQSLDDYDLKRFGGLYAHGVRTREQMKDVGIKFQATVRAPLHGGMIGPLTT